MKTKKLVPCSQCGSTTPCIMCRATKVYPYHPASGGVVWADCAACGGSGIEHGAHA